MDDAIKRAIKENLVIKTKLISLKSLDPAKAKIVKTYKMMPKKTSSFSSF